MNILEVLDQVRELLRTKGRITYRVLKRQFDLDDDYLEDLKAELIDAEHVARDEDGKVLVWVGASPVSSSKFQVSSSQSPTSSLQNLDFGLRTSDPGRWTPLHLAERIRAVSLTEGERKTITALFADLKGSTALIEGLDPEEARAFIDPALQLMMDAVHRYDGYVAQALGDGIFALFGAPLAHEDHPQRALYAALRMQEEMRRYADQVRLTHGAPLSMRVGVNTGEVVVRSIRKDDLHTDYVPVGHSINLAARMEQMATPGSILITEQTRKLTEGYFALKALGAAAIKGMEDPLNFYEVLGAGPLRTRLQVAARRGLTRFVGRHSELDQMQRALDQAKAGHGQIVGVMGEPGMGKSRLFYEFKLLSQGKCLILEAYSVSHGKASPYLPVIELLKSYFRIEPQDDERTRREKLTGKVLTLDRSLEDTLPYLFALLGIEEQPSPLQQMDPQIRRRRTFEAIKKLFLRESLNQPLILIFEDLHWIDTETQGFLDVLSESVANARILLLTNYRPEYRHEWGSKTYYTQLRLAPFGKDEAEEFLTILLGEHGLPLPAREKDRVRVNTDALQQLKHLILEKTAGTPFFMEEVVQTLVEEGVLVGERGSYRQPRAPSALHISPTVQGVLAARIDRLAPEEKALLQQLAVIGREFPVSLIRQVITQPEDDLYRLLASLQRKEFLYEHPAFPEVEYIFKHALTQEVAYNSVLIERRKALHEQTGQAIERLFHDRLEEHYDELAHHYRRSGNAEKAMEYLDHAGHQAVRRSANAEAVTHFTTALELLKTLPDTPERRGQDLALHTTLGPVLMVTKGYTAPEVEKTYTRARELCQQVGDTPQLFSVLWGLCTFYLDRRELRTSHELAEQLLALAQRVGDLALLVEARRMLSQSWCILGEFVRAREQQEHQLTLYASHRHSSSPLLSPATDPGVHGLNFAALTLWQLGYPDQARKKSYEALTLAQELAHPHSLVFALAVAALLHQFRREVEVVKERAEAMIALSSEQGFPFWLPLGMMARGVVLAEQGQEEEGIQQLQQGLAAARATGNGNWRSQFLALLAEAHGKVGQVKEGLDALAEALEAVDRTGERMHEAELYRLKGELTLAQSRVQSLGSSVQTSQKSKSKSQNSEEPNPNSQILDPQSEAEACFHKAIEVARRQQAKSLELRAVMSLARLWQQQGKQKDAHQVLSEIYGWFTEGFDTKDLQEAKKLLEALETP